MCSSVDCAWAQSVTAWEIQFPAKRLSANLGFEVPKGNTGLKLVFEPGFWSNKKVDLRPPPSHNCLRVENH